MQIPRQTHGYSLIELMIAVAIMGIIAAVAAPFITDYVGTSRVAVMRENIQTIRVFEDNYKLVNRVYVAGQYSPANPNVAGGLTDLIDWAPRSSDETIAYEVFCETDGAAPECTRTSGFYVVATDTDDGWTCRIDFDNSGRTSSSDCED